MQIILFSKFLQDKDIPGLVQLAGEHGLAGYDLCVRPGYVVNPDNADRMLPELMKAFADAGLSVPMATAPGDLVDPGDATAEPLVAALGASGVPILKLGYVGYEPDEGVDYWTKVDAFRKALDGWQALGRKHGVKLCYHTHSGNCLGVNCSALMHLLRGFDPRYVGAYIDPGHLVVNGEPFAMALAIVKDYLCAVALKDLRIDCERQGDEGSHVRVFPVAGEGNVAWSAVFAELVRYGFDGPLSVHGEYDVQNPREWLEKLGPEIAYFRRKLDAALKTA